jgi:hypothetical protein
VNGVVRLKLIRLAQKGKTIYYQELSDICGLGLSMKENEDDRAEIGRILDEISTFEFSNKRPILSSIVISQATGLQGEGFFKLCDRLGCGAWRKLQQDLEFSTNQSTAMNIGGTTQIQSNLYSI